MPDRPTYWLTRFLILRLLGIVYAVAFLAAINQILPLIGSHGLTPVDTFLQTRHRYPGLQKLRLSSPALYLLVEPL